LTKIHIPPSLYKEAKKRQKAMRSEGFNKNLIEIVSEIYMEQQHDVPTLKSIQSELRRLQEKNSSSSRKGGWLG